MKIKCSFLFILIFSLLISNVFANDKENQQWIIAASELKNINANTEENFNITTINAAAKQIPQLILGKVTEGMERIIVDAEKFERERYELQKQRQSYFTEMTNINKKRDSLIFSSNTKENIQKQIYETETKILELKEKILKNIQQEKALSSKNISEEKNTFFDNFFKEKIKNNIEVVSVWNNDISKLFSFDKTFIDPLAFKQEYEKAIIGAKINALMTGTIKTIGEYVSVQMELRQYPGDVLYATANDIGLISDMESLAVSLARQLLPSLINTVPVKIDMLILPEEDAEKSIIYIEDKVYRGSKNDFTLQPGIKNLRIETEGFKSININYDFSKSSIFFITINLQKENFVPLYFDFKNENKSVELNINALPQGNENVNVLINGKKYFGEILTEDKTSSFFVFDSNEINDSSLLKLKTINEDVTKKIEKSRKRFYRSYGYVLIAMPVYFIIQGNFEARQKAYNAGQLSSDGLNTWEIATYTSAGVLGGALINWGVQLFRYLIAANEVLPKTYTKENISSYVETKVNSDDNETINKNENESLNTEMIESKNVVNDDVDKMKLKEGNENGI
ncbi:MAG: hypothetical protein GX220_08965 [Treponema sp.]|nr:hypothetical protein [Treponema sp.]